MGDEQRQQAYQPGGQQEQQQQQQQQQETEQWEADKAATKDHSEANKDDE